MALAQFTRQFWFPSGVLAANLPARIFPLNSNALAILYTDGTGAVQLPNPVTTDINGTVTFWAEEGEYWIHIDDEVFRFSVGSPDIDLFEVVSHTMSTGVIYGGKLSVNAGNPSAVDITAMTGYVVDEATTPDTPIVTRVTTPAQTVVMDAGSLARTVTWWLINSAGAVIQQGTVPTRLQSRTHLRLGVTTQFGGVIVVNLSNPVTVSQPAASTADLMDSLGPFSIQGNQITPNGVNLSVNHSGGTLFSRAFNTYIGAALSRDPNVITSPAAAATQFRYITASALTFGPLVNTIDVANFDNGGVITPIGGGAGQSSIHRMWLFGTGDASTQMAIQYGQATYSSLTAAIDALGQTGHVVNPLIVGNGALIAYVIATRTATNLSDTSQARIFSASKFATP